MKPSLIVSSSDKERYDYAKKIASDNKWKFIPLVAKEAKFEIYKSSITSTLEGNLILFLIQDAERLTENDCLEILKYISNSPHRFIFSAKSSFGVKKILRDISLITKLDSISSDFDEIIRLLMKEEDRDLVRKKLLSFDVLKSDGENALGKFLHILKNYVWDSSPRTFRAIEITFQKIYMYRPEYLLSLLVYLLPPKKITMSSGNAGEKQALKDNFEEFISQVRKKYPRLSRNKIREIYKLFPIGWGKEEEKIIKPAKEKIKLEEKKPVEKILSLSKW